MKLVKIWIESKTSEIFVRENIHNGIIAYIQKLYQISKIVCKINNNVYAVIERSQTFMKFI